MFADFYLAFARKRGLDSRNVICNVDKACVRVAANAAKFQFNRQHWPHV